MAVRLELNGDTSEFDVKASGASRVDAREFEAADVDVLASGASNVDVLVTNSLSVELTGASKCRYFGDSEFIKIKADTVKGASSLKHGR